MPSTDLDKDIPFITEPDERLTSTRHYSFGQSLHPSPVHSRSPSFRDDRHLLGNRFMSTSLEELRRFSIGSMNSYQCQIHRKTSSKRSRRSQISDSEPKRYVHRNQSVRSSSRSPRPSYVSENGSVRRSSHSYQSVRRKSSSRVKAPIVQLSEEETLKENRRRKIVYIVIGTTLFLLLCAVLAVVITLTHQSQFSVENKTTTYYTFSPHPKLVYGELGNEGKILCIKFY